MEELGISFESAEPFGEFYAPAIGLEEKILRMDVFIIHEWNPEPKAGSEIEEIAWVDTQTASTMEIGSIFAHEVIPRLASGGRIS